MARWLLAMSRPGSLPYLGAESNRSSAASTSLPTFLEHQEQSGLCLTPDNILEEAGWCLVSSHPWS